VKPLLQFLAAIFTRRKSSPQQRTDDVLRFQQVTPSKRKEIHRTLEGIQRKARTK
jgi:hypothetical protein